MENYQHTFLLKQHSPIIHFQFAQQGATLRATELKPKLDKFIIEKQGGWSNIAPFWKVGKGRAQNGEALDYKIKIQSHQTEIKEIGNLDKWPAYFANMGKGEPKGLTMAKEEFKIWITCFCPPLLNYIKAHFAEFLAYTNFGTRQSKGFGSFYLSANDEHYRPPSLKHSFVVKTTANKDWTKPYNDLFFHIDLFYRAMRSGINIPKKAISKNVVIQGKNELLLENQTDFYCKAFLFSFLKSKNIQWDKKSIKEKYFNKYPEVRRKTIKKEKQKFSKDFIYTKGVSLQKKQRPGSEALNFSSKPDNILFRDLFGLSTEEKWQSYGTSLTKRHKRKNDRGHWKLVDKNDPDLIARFKSPILFKPFRESENKFRVYLHYTEPPGIYRGTKFLIDRSYKVGGIPDKDMLIASEKHFTFKAFFEFLFDKNELDIHKHIPEPAFQNYRDRNNYHLFGILKTILEQLQLPHAQ